MNPINQIYESNSNQIYEFKSNLWIQIKSMNPIQIKYMNPNQMNSSLNRFILLYFSFIIIYLLSLLFIQFHDTSKCCISHNNIALYIWMQLYCFVVACVYLVPSVLLCVCLLQLGIHICMRKSNPTKNPGRVVDIKICCDSTHHPNSKFVFAKYAELNRQS